MYTFELHFTKTQKELIEPGRELENKVVGGLDVFNTLNLFLEKQETTCVAGL